MASLQAALKITHHFGQILGIGLRRQPRRADDVAGQEGQMTPLSLGVGQARGRAARISLNAPPRRHRFRRPGRRRCLDQSLAVPERDAQLLELLVAEQQQGLAIDIVFNEQIGILTEADAIQPLMQIAAHLRPKQYERHFPPRDGVLKIANVNAGIVVQVERKFNTPGQALWSAPSPSPGWSEANPERFILRDTRDHVVDWKMRR
jgi:hypothetical protein